MYYLFSVYTHTASPQERTEVEAEELSVLTALRGEIRSTVKSSASQILQIQSVTAADGAAKPIHAAVHVAFEESNAVVSVVEHVESNGVAPTAERASSPTADQQVASNNREMYCSLFAFIWNPVRLPVVAVIGCNWLYIYLYIIGIYICIFAGFEYNVYRYRCQSQYN